MSDTTTMPMPTTLRPLEDRPFGYGGEGVPLDLARWLRVLPVNKVELGRNEGDVVLWSGRGHATTRLASCIGIGPSTTIDGETTLVTLPGHIIRQIDPIIEWERRNPEERRFGAETIDLKVLQVSAAHLLGTPAGFERTCVLDRLLSLRPESSTIRHLRERLRSDPHDTRGTCAEVVSAITDM